MKKILITGATGNIGIELIRYLFENENNYEIIAGVRDVQKAKQLFVKYENLEYVNFDFENQDTFANSFKDIYCIFLLRPPHISDVDKYFKPLLESAKKCGIKNIVFLSVQGAEKSKIIPHNKIEKLIIAKGFDYIFVRPSYFMQNLTTTLYNEIKENNSITLPAGKAKFNWIDIENIAEVSSNFLKNFDTYKNKAFEITGNENENFQRVTEKMSSILGFEIKYKNESVLKFYRNKIKQGIPKGFVMVMIMLHFIPRFQPEPEISEFYTQITGKQPTTIEDFIKREFAKFNEK